MEHRLVAALPQILKDFGQAVERRLAQEIQTTEDAVRYYFFLRLLKEGIHPEKMIFERSHPHHQLSQKEIDLSVIHPDGMLDFEIKYHRPIPSGRNRPFTQLRGQVVSDLYKLALSDGQQRYLLYVADPQMVAHWERQMKALVRADRMSPMRLTREWLTQQAKTLKETVRGGLGFFPEDITPSVWVESSWAGALSKYWLFRVV